MALDRIPALEIHRTRCGGISPVRRADRRIYSALIPLVSRFRRSYHFAARAYERRNRKDTRKPMILVWFLILTFLPRPLRGNRNVKITTIANSTLRIVNLPDAGAHGEMHMHLLTRNRRPRALMEASGIALRCGPTFHFRTLFLIVSGNYFRIPAGATSTPINPERLIASAMNPDARASSMKRSMIAIFAASPLGAITACSTP
jgi:hypothetical protein